MPKRGIVALAITTLALVLLLSFKTPDDTLPGRPSGNVAIVEAGSATSPRSPASAAPGATRAPAATTPVPSAATRSGTGGAAATVAGPVVSTRYGSIQVEVVVAAGRVQDVVALQLPTGQRSGQISQYASPILRGEALQAQSANIDLVSGATYTSDAYAQSLQAALDQAGVR